MMALWIEIHILRCIHIVPHGQTTDSIHTRNKVEVNCLTIAEIGFILGSDINCWQEFKILCVPGPKV